MGDRYILTLTCPSCGEKQEDVWYAPTCGVLTFTCGCGEVIDLAKLTGITREDASNRDVLDSMIKRLRKGLHKDAVIEIYQTALEQIANDPYLNPEANAELAQAALDAAELHTLKGARMLTQKDLESLERNYKAYAREILTPEAYPAWHPIILGLIEQARSAINDSPNEAEGGDENES